MQKTRSTGRDRKLVAATQKHEVRYTAKKMGANPKAVKQAVKRVGHSRKRVESALSGRQS